MRDVVVEWVTGCSICCCTSLKHPRSGSVTVVVWYVGYTRWFGVCVLVLQFRSDRVIVWVSGTSSMSADAEYMRFDLLFRVLICSSLGCFERCECVYVCVVCNRCVFDVYYILWCLGYFTAFYNTPLQTCLTPNKLRRWACLQGDNGFVRISAGFSSVGI